MGKLLVEDDVQSIGAVGKHVKEEKLDETQARPSLNFSNKSNGEFSYLNRMVRSRHKVKDSSEVELLKKVVEIVCKTKPMEDGDALRLIFVHVSIFGKNFVELVDTRATHSFLSKK